MKLARPDLFHPRLVLAGCPALPGGTADDAGLVGALRRRGLHARWLSWDDPAISRAHLVMLRAVTDVADRLEEFLAWATATTHLVPAAQTVAWNVDRRYLLDLAGHRVATVPAAVFAPGEPVTLPHTDTVVVAPAVGAGARSFTDRHAAHGYAEQLHTAGRAVLVQPHDARPVTSLVFLAGRASHAFTAAGAADPDFTVWDVGLAALDAAAQRLRLSSAEFLTARADVTGGPDDPRLLRLRLISPGLGWLTLDDHTRAVQQRQFALAVESALERRGLGPLSQRRP